VLTTTQLTLESTLANISAGTNICKQSTGTFKVFVLWLRNEHYYTCDVIGIKMMHRDLPYFEGIGAKTHCEYKLHENKHENHANHLHTVVDKKFPVQLAFTCYPTVSVL